MKRYIRSTEYVMAMANVNKKRTGLKVNIWSDGQGCLRNKPDVIPRVKLVTDSNESVSVSISDHPLVLAPKTWKKRFKQSTVAAIEEAIQYVARNYDLFMKHYMDKDLSFDDSDLFDSLKQRGEYK